MDKTACFFGHRKVTITEELKGRVYKEVEKMICVDGIEVFLFGSKSQFDDLCYEVVNALKNKYPYIQRVYVRAEFPYIDDTYLAHLLKWYDDTYYPEKMIAAGKASYVERNREMINKSSVCLVYYDKTYLPPRRKQSKYDLTDYQPTSGTGLAYAYAEKKKKKIINLCEDNHLHK